MTIYTDKVNKSTLQKKQKMKIWYGLANKIKLRKLELEKLPSPMQNLKYYLYSLIITKSTIKDKYILFRHFFGKTCFYYIMMLVKA